MQVKHKPLSGRSELKRWAPKLNSLMAGAKDPCEYQSERFNPLTTGAPHIILACTITFSSYTCNTLNIVNDRRKSFEVGSQSSSIPLALPKKILIPQLYIWRLTSKDCELKKWDRIALKEHLFFNYANVSILMREAIFFLLSLVLHSSHAIFTLARICPSFP